MSYDLYFTSPSISVEEFNNYFSQNPLYELNNGQAFYKNEATGVYFFFNHEAGNEDDYEFNVEVSFNLNYYRPHFFGLEACNEVEKFISYFNCEIEDPQNEGMGNSLFTREGFLKGWNSGNKFAVKSFIRETSICPHPMPTKKLEEVWQWNYSIAEKNKTYGPGLFIPKIIFMEVDGNVGTCAVWPDAIPTLVPKVDFLYVPRKENAPNVPRKENAPKKFLIKGKQDNCIIHKRDFPEFFLDYISKDTGIEAFLLPNPETPNFIKKYVSSLTAFEGQIEGIAIDTVLNKELVEAN